MGMKLDRDIADCAKYCGDQGSSSIRGQQCAGVFDADTRRPQRRSLPRARDVVAIAVFRRLRESQVDDGGQADFVGRAHHLSPMGSGIGWIRAAQLANAIGGEPFQP